MKKGWQTKTLEEVCQFSNGLWKGEKPPFVNVGVIRNTNFTKDGTLDDADIAFLNVEAKKLEKRRLRSGDIILEKSGGGPKQPVGRVALFDIEDGDFSFSNFTAALRVRDPRELDFRFLHKFLHWTYLSGVTEGMQSNSTGIRNLNGDAYKAIQITFPPLPEQQRIVGILDETFVGIAAAKANTNTNLQNARALSKSQFEGVFSPRARSWTANPEPLDNLCDLIVDCEHRTAPTQNEGIPSIRTPNIGRGRLLLNGVHRVSERTYREWTRRAEPQPGDLVLAREAPAGNVAVIPENLRVCLGQRTVLIRVKRSVFEPEFLALTLLQSRMQKKLLGHSRGATVQHVNMKDIRALNVGPIPPLSAQRKMVAVVGDVARECERLESLYNQKRAALEALRNALLQHAFSGNL